MTGGHRPIGHAAGTAGLRVLAVAGRRVEHHRVLPDPGCYEERYRLTGRVAWQLAVIPVFLAAAFLLPGALPAQLIAVALAIPALPRMIGPVSRRIAFRADHAGVTLGADPASWPVRRVPAVFVPWADVERIIIYPR